MDMFVSINALDRIRFSSLKTESWYVEEARTAMERGSILYAGKYSAPDYEQILDESCGLAIENTMIDLRPVQFERDNIFVDMVKMLYKADTPTNVLPSIHVFNSIGVCIAISHNRVLSRRKVIHYGSLVLGISIILATMFLKQHSVIDVTLAGCLATLLYPVVYARESRKSFHAKEPRQSIKKAVGD